MRKPMTFPDHVFASRVQALSLTAEQRGQPVLASKLREIEEWCRGSGVPPSGSATWGAVMAAVPLYKTRREVRASASRLVAETTTNMFGEVGCSDGGCVFGHPGGMHTNGGCSHLTSTEHNELRRHMQMLSQVAHRLAEEILR